MDKVFSRLFLAVVSLFLIATSIRAQQAKPENVGVDTPDGLRLAGTWYKAQGGKDSDCVLLLHNYGAKFSSNTGEWENLALALQKEGYSVLQFDLRGHGSNKGNTKTVNDAPKFCFWKYNLKAGFHSLNPDSPPKNLKLDVNNFQAGYYPFLLNDIAGARYFLDKRNDQGQCNSGRINIIADRQSCPLAMAWIAMEFARNGKYKVNPQTDLDPPPHDAGTDVMSLVCLSYQDHKGFEPGSVLSGVTKYRKEMPSSFKKKISVLFIDNQKNANAAAGPWFARWGLAGKKGDSDTRKYATTIEKSDTLTGIDLLGAKKQLGVEAEIIEFLNKSKTPTKGKVALNGNDWTLRNTDKESPVPFLMELFGRFP